MPYLDNNNKFRQTLIYVKHIKHSFSLHLTVVEQFFFTLATHYIKFSLCLYRTKCTDWVGFRQSSAATVSTAIHWWRFKHESKRGFAEVPAALRRILRKFCGIGRIYVYCIPSKRILMAGIIFLCHFTSYKAIIFYQFHF